MDPYKLSRKILNINIVTIVNIIVIAIRNIPRVLALLSLMSRYLIPGIIPRGGNNTLKIVSPIVLGQENLNGGSLSFLPQFEQ